MANPTKETTLLADKNSKGMIANRQTLVADPSGGATIDTQARTAINAILDILEAHGLMADA